MPRVKKSLRNVGEFIVIEEWTETYFYRVETKDFIFYVDDLANSGMPLIRMERKDGKYVGSSYSTISNYPELEQAIMANKAEKGEWTFVFETESDYS